MKQKAIEKYAEEIMNKIQKRLNDKYNCESHGRQIESVAYVMAYELLEIRLAIEELNQRTCGSKKIWFSGE